MAAGIRRRRGCCLRAGGEAHPVRGHRRRHPVRAVRACGSGTGSGRGGRCVRAGGRVAVPDGVALWTDEPDQGGSGAGVRRPVRADTAPALQYRSGVHGHRRAGARGCGQLHQPRRRPPGCHPLLQRHRARPGSRDLGGRLAVLCRPALASAAQRPHPPHTPHRPPGAALFGFGARRHAGLGHHGRRRHLPARLRTRSAHHHPLRARPAGQTDRLRACPGHRRRTPPGHQSGADPAGAALCARRSRSQHPALADPRAGRGRPHSVRHGAGRRAHHLHARRAARTHRAPGVAATRGGSGRAPRHGADERHRRGGV